MSKGHRVTFCKTLTDFSLHGKINGLFLNSSASISILLKLSKMAIYYLKNSVLKVKIIVSKIILNELKDEGVKHSVKY